MPGVAEGRHAGSLCSSRGVMDENAKHEAGYNYEMLCISMTDVRICWDCSCAQMASKMFFSIAIYMSYTCKS